VVLFIYTYFVICIKLKLSKAMTNYTPPSSFGSWSILLGTQSPPSLYSPHFQRRSGRQIRRCALCAGGLLCPSLWCRRVKRLPTVFVKCHLIMMCPYTVDYHLCSPCVCKSLLNHGLERKHVYKVCIFMTKLHLEYKFCFRVALLLLCCYSINDYF
jgi:hypothetical protein